MPISSISGIAGSDFTTHLGRRKNTYAESSHGNRNSGPDTVSFSEKALRLAQAENPEAMQTEKEKAELRHKLKLEESANASKARSDLSGLGKKSMFAMLLESLFLADLEESAASGDPAGGETAEGSLPKAPEMKSVNPLQDGEKATEIKKVFSDITKGKADLSDVAKAMAVGAGSGNTGSVASKGSGQTSNGKEAESAVTSL